MIVLDLTDDEKAMLRNSVNSLSAQMNAGAARVFVSLVDKVNAATAPKEPSSG